MPCELARHCSGLLENSTNYIRVVRKDFQEACRRAAIAAFGYSVAETAGRRARGLLVPAKRLAFEIE